MSTSNDKRGALKPLDSSHEKDAEISETFDHLVNMTAKELEHWLNSDESRAVGQKAGNHESVGHQSGRHIVRILHKKRAELTRDDFTHMSKVVGYIKRHKAQRPAEVEHSAWRYSLMNWGHDPVK